MCVLGLSQVTLWEGGSNIIDWQWTQQSASESKVIFFLNHLGDRVCKKKSAMFGLGISFVANVGWIAIR
jgi:hypothetical protein